MKVSVSEIESAFKLLTMHLRATGHEEIDIEKDFYWELSSDSRFRIEEEPRVLGLGQLSHDWERIEQFLNGEAEPISYGLCWLASILRTIGEDIIS